MSEPEQRKSIFEEHGNAPGEFRHGRPHLVYWRDIPAQVIIKKGRATAKRELSLRFTEAIDMCAMRTGAAETDDYLAEWRKADPVPVSDDLEAEADKAAAEFEEAYDRERLVALVKAGGRDNA